MPEDIVGELTEISEQRAVKKEQEQKEKMRKMIEARVSELRQKMMFLERDVKQLEEREKMLEKETNFVNKIELKLVRWSLKRKRNKLGELRRITP